jgi:hypothetical protein
MRTVIVTDRDQEWLQIPDATVTTARRYLADAEAGRHGSVRLLNFCRTGRYQGRGYYVSLLAEARGERPLPDVKTVEDLKSEARIEALSDELASLTQQTLSHDESDRFELHVYLGNDPAQRHQALAEKVFANVPAPLLRALFGRVDGQWRLQDVQLMGVADIPVQHRAFLVGAVKTFAAQASATLPRRDGASRPRLAILWDRDEPHKPSNDEALRRLLKAATVNTLAIRRLLADATVRKGAYLFA